MRVLGVKGGVGKTTISLYLSKQLSLNGKCLLIDLDNLSYGSLFLGHDKIGLYDEMRNGNKFFTNSLQKINETYVLKVFSDPFIRTKISKNEKFLLSERINELLNKGWDFVIIDTPSVVDEDDIVFSINADKIVNIFIADPMSVKLTINFFFNKYKHSYMNILILNLIPPIKKSIEEYEKTLRQYENLFDILVLETFEEGLYLYKPSKVSNFESKNLNKLVEAIIRRQKIIVVPS
ncbi:MAG: ParA family protein [Saccharolobus sp.]|jgi:septum site-determining protein MinD|uniref:ParA family protein n=1 Tax=Saccharolobus sp. TaxID=2100761 RepID=UPI0028CD51D6|nr:ParA family protein [Saccharolobus sp.]MDT7862392.1 ParA family protein [Saccharolobus sp.]